MLLTLIMNLNMAAGTVVVPVKPPTFVSYEYKDKYEKQRKEDKELMKIIESITEVI